MFLPKNLILDKMRLIAGKNHSNAIRDEKFLIEKNGGKPGEWKKIGAIVYTKKYMFDIHFYSLNKKQYDIKVKVVENAKN